MPSSHPMPSPWARGRQHRALAWACWVLALVLPLTVALQGLGQIPAPLLAQAGLETGLAGREGLRWSLWALSLLPVVCLSFSLVQAGLCFLQFARAEYLTTQVVVQLRRFTAGLLAAGVLGLVLPTALSALLSTVAPPGQRSLVVSVGSQDVIFLLLAALLWQIASVIARAVAIDEENRQFV